jgi:hypothetical protein
MSNFYLKNGLTHLKEAKLIFLPFKDLLFNFKDLEVNLI